MNKQINIFFYILHWEICMKESYEILFSFINKSVKGWIDPEIGLATSSSLYSPRRHEEAQILQTGFKGNRMEQGWRSLKISNRNRHPSPILAHLGRFAVASTLTSGHLLGMLLFGPIQQVHLGSLLGRDTAPGPALVPKVVQWRGILQLTGEVKAALQTCKDSQWSVEQTVSQM